MLPFQSLPEMILKKQPTLEGVYPPLWGKRFLQQNPIRAAKNTACYLPVANKICPLTGTDENARFEP